MSVHSHSAGASEPLPASSDSCSRRRSGRLTPYGSRSRACRGQTGKRQSPPVNIDNDIVCVVHAGADTTGVNEDSDAPPLISGGRHEISKSESEKMIPFR